jgi:mono/diheme cytochrome c family protein
MQTSTVLIVPAMVFAAVLTAGLTGRGVLAQENGKTVADGVYSDEQATRGAASYDTSCSGCHRPDLGGANGPALRGERFARIFAGKDLQVLYTKIATTMPRGAAASLGDAVYLDIVAHILRENGFPAGSVELTAEGLGSVQVLPGRPKPPPPVGDFSYVDVVGCLTPGPDNTWLLTNASEPVALAVTGPEVRHTEATDRALGTQAFRLLDAMAYNPESHKGHKMYVKGLLIKIPGEQRMTISSFEMLAPSCQ